VSGPARIDGSADPAPVRLTVPDLGLAGVTLVLSLWLVPEGSDVIEGDRVAELLAAGVTIDLAAPVSGRFARALADEDDAVFPGAVLAEFVAGSAADGEEG
jgi:pyruvate/2-oxoglutarate dehydrogenase complex dihydrolipoamide acyltransferase (E2) component